MKDLQRNDNQQLSDKIMILYKYDVEVKRPNLYTFPRILSKVPRTKKTHTHGKISKQLLR
jgi:hypothetical protein